MRLAVVSPFVDRRHGTERALAELLERLAHDHGCEIHLYAQRVADLSVSPPETISGAGAIIWHKVPSLPGPHLLQFLAWMFFNGFLRWWHRKCRGIFCDLVLSPGINCLHPDVVIVHALFHRLRELSRQEGAPSPARTTVLRGWHRSLYYLLLTGLERRIYADPRVSLAAVSRRTAGLLQEYFHRADVRVIPNAVDASHFSPAARLAKRTAMRSAWGFRDDEFVLLLIGNDWNTKGLPALLRSLPSLADQPLRLLVLGSDAPQPFQSLAADLGVGNRCVWELPRADVLDFYAAADLYVSPSREDSFGLPVAEAMACGLPVITSALAGVSEYVQDGITGFVLLDPRDSQTLASHIRRLCADREFRQRMGTATSSAASQWTWDKSAAELARCLVSLKESKGKGLTVPSAENQPRGKNPLPALTGIRFLAAFYVVLFHSLPWLRVHFQLPAPLLTFVGNGYLAVGLFFLLSGFILAYTYDRQIEGSQNRRDFWMARFARIYPVYFLSLLLAYPFERQLSLGTQATVLAMVQAWDPRAPSLAGAWNYPAWSLSVEAFFYVCLPFLLPLIARLSLRNLRVLAGTLLLTCVFCHTPVRGLGNWDQSSLLSHIVPLPILRIPEFLLGVSLGLAFLRAARRKANPVAVSLALVGLFLALSLPIGPWVSVVMLPFAALVYELAEGGGFIASFLSTRLMVLLGGASYSVYLLQFPIRSWTRVLLTYAPESIRKFGSPLTPVILVLFSIIVFKFWEEPLRKGLRGRGPEKRVDSPQGDDAPRP